MIKIRQANSNDLDALYLICLKTGDMGSDASQQYLDPKMLGHIYAAPYLKYCPELTFVAEKNDTVLGYCVGTPDTYKFEAILEAEWWPSLRLKYPKLDQKTQEIWSQDERMCQMIHHPETIPQHVVDRAPAHLHMNLLPEIQGSGVGASLLESWMQKAAQLNISAVHIGAGAENERGVRFWEKQRFIDLDEHRERPNSGTVWMRRQLS